MIVSLGDRVLVKTEIIRCRILGTVQQIHDEKVLVVFDHPMRGRREVWAHRSACQATKTKDPIEVKNRKIKNHAKKVISGLEVIK